jgi:hypothetical protein
MGPGMMHCGMMGPCGSSHRGPENCLHGAPGGGYGRKPQMMRHRSGYGMGPGMMHRGGCGMGPGYGRGPGMMGSGRPDRDDDRQYYKGQGSQPE